MYIWTSEDCSGTKSIADASAILPHNKSALHDFQKQSVFRKELTDHITSSIDGVPAPIDILFDELQDGIEQEEACLLKGLKEEFEYLIGKTKEQNQALRKE